MAPRFTISDSVRRVLAESEITETSVKLPPEQLERSLYLEVNKVLEGAGGKWDRKSRSHLFGSDPRALLGIAVETGQAINKQQLFQAFYTPASLALELAECADLQEGMTMLEPSCGEGNLIAAALSKVPTLKIQGIEIQPDAVAKVRALFPAIQIRQADFLQVEPEPIFDRVVMNPPFTKDQDIQHVSHAWKFVKPGGRLVSVMFPVWQTSKTKACVEFRKLAKGAAVKVIPAGTFKESGTNIPTVRLVLVKPT